MEELGLVSGSVSTLSTGMIALLAWVVIMTLALVAIAIVVFRRWRHVDGSFDTGSMSSGASSADLSDITSSAGSATDQDPEASLGGHRNSAYTEEGDEGTKL